MLSNHNIQSNIQEIKKNLPDHVILEAAAKTRSVDEVLAAIQTGITHLGYNYVQEAESIRSELQENVRWHMIGHLQKNKVKKAVHIFDMIETVDSVELAQRINKECEKIDKKMDVLIEVNSGRETRKAGVAPEKVETLVRSVCNLPNICIKGLMTMGPNVKEPEMLRPFFKNTREIFDRLAALNIQNIEMSYLSMGMSDSYPIAIEEGANIIRLGTVLFGPRTYR